MIGICINFCPLFSDEFSQVRPTAVPHSSPPLREFFSLSMCRYPHSTEAYTNQMGMTDPYIEARQKYPSTAVGGAGKDVVTREFSLT